MSKPSGLVLCAGDLARASEGRMVSGRSDVRVDGFSIDSRRVKRGDLFVAIRGARLDGHNFVSEAIQRGAAGVVVGDSTLAGFKIEVLDQPFVIAVENTTRALQLMGREIRRRSGARVVAITGSIGKTTTKELIANVLASAYRVCCSEGNLNNHIGVPLSLLELRHEPEVAVVELGMNHAGEISTLVSLAEPEMRVWTNVAEVHSAFFGSIEAIADAKAEILEGATEKSQLVANAGDPRVMARAQDFPGSVVTFGVEMSADVTATQVKSLGLDGMEAMLQTPVGLASVRTQMLGHGHLANIVAAVAVALQFNVPLEVVVERVAEYVTQPRRGQVIRLGDVTVVDDTYNSSPTALETALEAVGRTRGCVRRVAVLGEMLELGARSVALHEACGRAAVAAGFDAVIAVGGSPALALAEGARVAGLPEDVVMTFATSGEAAEYVTNSVQVGDVVLVKGSRGIKMDQIVDRLKVERMEN